MVYPSTDSVAALTDSDLHLLLLLLLLLLQSKKMNK